MVAGFVTMLERDPSTGVRIEVATALGRMGKLAQQAVGQLRKVAHLTEAAPTIDHEGGDAAVELRIAAAAALARISGDSLAVPWLMEIVRDKGTHWSIRESAVTALGETANGDAVPLLTDLVRSWKAGSEIGEVGFAAIPALGKIGKHADVVLPVLLPLVQDPWLENGSYSYGALLSLEDVGRIMPATELTRSCLRTALQYRDEEARLIAAKSLVSMGYGSPEVVRVLIELLELETSPIPIFRGFSGKLRAVEMRRGAAEVLGKLGAEARPAVPALTKAKHDEFPSVRRAAEAALLHIGDAM
jgi:HEAT repeat protein